MTNLTIKEMLWTRYNALAYAHDYILGFTFKGVVYAITVDSNVCSKVLKLDKASRGAGYALRFKPNTSEKIFLLGLGATAICSVEYFNALVSESKYNRGEIFEKLVTENAGQVWEKDNVPFTEAGDIEIDNVAYQIKFEKATYTNEKSLARLEK